MTDLKTKIEKLLELDDFRKFKGEWQRDDGACDDPYGDIAVKSGKFFTVCNFPLDDAPVHDHNAEQSTNAALAIYAVNHSPEIIRELVKQRDMACEARDSAYTQRMICVRLLAINSGCVFGVGKDDNDSWDDEWRNVVYIDLPQGQVSWHIAPNDMHLFEDFPPYAGKWDGKFSGGCPDFAKQVLAQIEGGK